MGRVSFKLDSFQGIHPALKDLADLNCGSNSCAARANGRPRTTHRFHYYFRNNLHLFVRMQISLSLSLSLPLEGKRASSARPLFVPTFVRDRRPTKFCNLLTFERSLTPRVSLFAILSPGCC